MKARWIVLPFLGIMGVGYIFLAVACGGQIWLPDFLSRITYGWVRFLTLNLKEITFNWSLIGGALLTFFCLIVAVHLLMRQFYNGLEADGTPRFWPKRWSVTIVFGVLMLFVSGIAAIGVTHQISWIRSSPNQFTFNLQDEYLSRNNLQQIEDATQRYSHQSSHLPGTTFAPEGFMLHGWQTQLLPFVENSRLYSKIKLDQPWNAEVNRPIMSVEVYEYLRSYDYVRKDEQGFALSHYAGNIHVLGTGERKTFDSFKDRGRSNTILAGEVDTNFKPWGHPMNVRDPALGFNRSPNGFGAGKGKPTQILMLDGSIRNFRDDTDPEFLKLLTK